MTWLSNPARTSSIQNLLKVARTERCPRNQIGLASVWFQQTREKNKIVQSNHEVDMNAKMCSETVLSHEIIRYIQGVCDCVEYVNVSSSWYRFTHWSYELSPCGYSSWYSDDYLWCWIVLAAMESVPSLISTKPEYRLSKSQMLPMR